MTQEERERKRIIVLGAGVIGLQCAIHLLRTNRYHVTILAKHLPSDGDGQGSDAAKDVKEEYASPWAGAHWRPHSGLHDLEEQAWDTETYYEWLKTAEAEEQDACPAHDRSGITILPSLLEWEATHPEVQPHGLDSLWFRKRVKGFVALDTSSSDEAGAILAARFTSVTVNVPKYLQYLRRNVERMGGVVHRTILPLEAGLEETCRAAAKIANAAGEDSGEILTKLPTASPPSRTVDGAGADKIAAFINATGINARVLDATVHPIRGQTVLIEGAANQITNRKGTDPTTGANYSAYAIPRPASNETVLGGCHIKGDWSVDVDNALTDKILAWGKGMCPELLKDDGSGGKAFVVKRVAVGLRPGREGGARVEVERVCGEQGGPWEGEIVVVHAYGHGGAGYQNSMGVASKVVRLVGQGIHEAKI